MKWRHWITREDIAWPCSDNVDSSSIYDIHKNLMESNLSTYDTLGDKHKIGKTFTWNLIIKTILQIFQKKTLTLKKFKIQFLYIPSRGDYFFGTLFFFKFLEFFYFKKKENEDENLWILCYFSSLRNLFLILSR